MEAMLERIARLEQLVGVAPASAEGHGVTGAGGRGVPAAHASLNKWLAAEHRPGTTTVIGGAAKDGALWTSLRRWDSGDDRGCDWRGIAAVCQALGHEARLGLLRELEGGPRTTAELLAAGGLDRGQLHHHLKELLLQGLVAQPERGRYAATRRGQQSFLLSCVLPTAPDAPSPAPDATGLDLGDGEEAPGPAPEPAPTS